MSSDYRFDTSHLEWIHYEGGPGFDYPIDYKVAVLGHQDDAGLLDLMVKWAPNSYCHFHRHVAATTTLVLEGEHHVVDIDENGNEAGHEVRPAGTYRNSSGGEAHMEYAGPDGSTVLFTMHESSGRMFDVLDKDLNLLAVATIDSFVQEADQARATGSD